MFRPHRHHRPSRKFHQITGILPLSVFPAGQTGIVVEIRGGNEFLSRMVSLGFSPGTEVIVLQNYIHGPVLTCVRDSRLALGRGEAQKILLHVNNDDTKYPHHS